MSKQWQWLTHKLQAAAKQSTCQIKYYLLFHRSHLKYTNEPPFPILVLDDYRSLLSFFVLMSEHYAQKR